MGIDPTRDRAFESDCGKALGEVTEHRRHPLGIGVSHRKQYTVPLPDRAVGVCSFKLS